MTKVLIVEPVADLGRIWSRHLERQGMSVTVASGQSDAMTALAKGAVDVILLDLVLDEGSALAIADFANYRYPEAKVVFVSNTTFFSDGSIFQHCSNACAYVPRSTAPEDLAAMVEHYSGPVTPDRAVRSSPTQG